MSTGNELQIYSNMKVTVRRTILDDEWFWEVAIGYSPHGPSEWRRLNLNDSLDRIALGSVIPESQWGSTTGPESPTDHLIQCKCSTCWCERCGKERQLRG